MNEKEQKTYTVQDVINAEYLLYPLRCIHCGYVDEVVYHQYIGDGYCQICGKWQLGEHKK